MDLEVAARDRNRHWKLTTRTLAERGFQPAAGCPAELHRRWYVTRGGTESPSTCLAIKHVLKLDKLIVDIGWRLNKSYEFVVRALQVAWPKGYDWLKSVYVLDLPCLNAQSLASMMPGNIGGITLRNGDDYVCGQLSLLLDDMERRRWTTLSTVDLLQIYATDIKPLDWYTTNAAIRIGQVAGLTWTLGADLTRFDACVRQHHAQIAANMYNLGSADVWIRELRGRVIRGD